MQGQMMSGYEGRKAYSGGVHSYCALSYGPGCIEDAFATARQQPDFAGIAAHDHWPDMPAGEGHRAAIRCTMQSHGITTSAGTWS